MENKFFLVQIKRTSGVYSKGVVVKDSEAAARQGFHAYLGAYGYGNDANTDYVSAAVMNMNGAVVASCVDNRIPVPESEPEVEE